LEKRQSYLLSPLLSYIILKVLASEVRQEKKRPTDWTRDFLAPIFKWHDCLHRKFQRNTGGRLRGERRGGEGAGGGEGGREEGTELELIKKFSNVTVYKANEHK
jgi:hypothetical protein